MEVRRCSDRRDRAHPPVEEARVLDREPELGRGGPQTDLGGAGAERRPPLLGGRRSPFPTGVGEHAVPHLGERRHVRLRVLEG